MPTYTALTTLPGKDAAEALAEAMETLAPEPTGIGVVELEDGRGHWEVGGYFDAAPDEAGLALLAAIHGSAPFAVSQFPRPTGSPGSGASCPRSRRGASSCMVVMTRTRCRRDASRC